MTPDKNPSDKTVSYDKENLLKRKLEEVVLNGNFLKWLLKRKLNYSESKYIDFLLYTSRVPRLCPGMGESP